MAEIVIFHHVLGLTPGVVEIADKFRTAGHTIHAPDLFDGRVFSTLDEGLDYAREVGFDEVTERGIRAASELPVDLVYIGFSLGVVPAQQLAQTRAGARGAIFIHACLPVSEFGGEWPQGVPIQVHAMDHDPFFMDEGDIDAAKELVEQAAEGEIFLYPGDQHLFADSSLPSYVADATDLLLERVLNFLAGV